MSRTGGVGRGGLAISIAAALAMGSIAVDLGRRAAGAAEPARWAYVFASSLSQPDYIPTPKAQKNSTGALNRITRSGPGEYTVRFPGQVSGLNGGTVDVTALGTTGFCKVANWTESGADILANVRCFAGDGTPFDAYFEAAYVNPGTAHPKNFAYVWANLPSSLSYTPSEYYQFNSKGARNKIVRPAIGRYTVSIPRVGLDSGTVKVTANGAAATQCQVVNWVGSPTLEIAVACRDTSGVYVDEQFTVTWVDTHSLLGLKGRPRAYVWANQPTSNSYTPDPWYQQNSTGATNTITRVGVGIYAVDLPNLHSNYGHVHVTAYGSTFANCNVGTWGPAGTAQRVLARCYNAAGSPIDATFTVQYVK